MFGFEYTRIELFLSIHVIIAKGLYHEISRIKLKDAVGMGDYIYYVVIIVEKRHVTWELWKMSSMQGGLASWG